MTPAQLVTAHMGRAVGWTLTLPEDVQESIAALWDNGKLVPGARAAFETICHEYLLGQKATEGD